MKSTEPAQSYELTRDSACCGTCCWSAVNQIVPAKFIPAAATSAKAEITQTGAATAKAISTGVQIRIERKAATS